MQPRDCGGAVLEMLRHYLTIAWRGLLRDRFHTAVSVAGLALGLASFVGAYVFADYVSSGDRKFPHSERILAMFQRTSVESMDLSLPMWSSTSTLLAAALRAEFPELEAIARSLEREQVVSVGPEHSYRRVRYAEPDFVRIFELPFVAGGAAALTHARDAVLTVDAATALFGGTDVLGKIVRVGDNDVPVAAIVGPIPPPSHLGRSIGSDGFEALIVTRVPADIEGSPEREPPEELKWVFTTQVETYLLLPADGSLTAEAINARLPELVARRVHAPTAKIAFEARPVEALTTEAANDILFLLGNLSMSGLLLVLGGLVLATACLNFVNLAVARAVTRAGEIGLRKTLGAGRAQVVMQHLCESTLVAIAAAVIAVAGLELAVPVVNRWVDLALAPPHDAPPQVWLFLAAVTVGVGLASGAYPALVLSGVRPISALRAGAVRAGSSVFRTLVIGVQFVLASFLLIAVVVMALQNWSLRSTALGIDEDPIVAISTQPFAAKVDSETLRTRLLASPAIARVTGAGRRPWENTVGGTGYSRTPDKLESFQFTQTQSVWYDYFDTLGMKILAGRGFSRDFADPEGAPGVVIDRLAAEQFGWTNPADAIGQTIYQTPFAGKASPQQIVGVVEHAPRGLVGWGARSFVYILNDRDMGFPLIQVSRNDVPAALAHIDSVWRTLAPETPLRREFADETFDASYRMFDNVSRAFIVLASFAFVIAVMGLLGMVLFITTRRRREVGVRKVLGATSKRIFALLLFDFLRPVLVANVIAWPLAFAAARAYLNVFMKPIPLTPAPFVASLAVTLAIAAIVVLHRALESARVAPADLARHE
jgi:putative ABC transport system permease protein